MCGIWLIDSQINNFLGSRFKLISKYDRSVGINFEPAMFTRLFDFLASVLAIFKFDKRDGRCRTEEFYSNSCPRKYLPCLELTLTLGREFR